MIEEKYKCMLGIVLNLNNTLHFYVDMFIYKKGKKNTFIMYTLLGIDLASVQNLVH